MMGGALFTVHTIQGAVKPYLARQKVAGGLGSLRLLQASPQQYASDTHPPQRIAIMTMSAERHPTPRSAKGPTDRSMLFDHRLCALTCWTIPSAISDR